MINTAVMPMNNSFNLAKPMNYVSTITYAGNDPDLFLTINNKFEVEDNIGDSINTRGHFEHQAYKAHKLFSGKEAQEFRQYLKSEGKPTAKSEGYVIINKTGRTVARIYRDRFTQHVAPSISMEYHEMIAEEAKDTGKSFKAVEINTILHEIAHSKKTPKNIVNNLIYGIRPFAAEKDAEKAVYKYALEKSRETDDPEQKKMWEEVAELSESRYNNVRKIYSRRNRKRATKEDKDPKESEHSEKYKGKDKQDIEKNNDKEANPEDNLEARVEGNPEGENTKGEKKKKKKLHSVFFLFLLVFCCWFFC